MITYDQLREVMPHAPPDLIRFVSPLNITCEEFEINTKARITSFLAQLGHESGQFRYMEELADGSAYEGRRDLGNHEQEAINAAQNAGSTPGRFYKGHGPIQITGYYNHRACGQALELDLVTSPTLITSPLHGCRAAGWFWKSRGLNALADSGKQEALRRRVNGGLNGFADVMATLERAERVFT